MRRIDLPELDICLQYLQGASVKSIGDAHGVSRLPIYRILRGCGIVLRSASEQARLDAQKVPFAQRQLRAKAANAAARGSKAPESRLIAAALTRMKNAKMTDREARWAAALASEGVATIPQYALGRYSLDLASPSAKVGIEVQNGWHLCKKGRSFYRDARKKAYAESVGWTIFAVFDWHFRKPRFYEIIKKVHASSP